MSLAQKAAKGAAWTVLTSLVSRGLGLAGTLLLVRFVAPDDYGEASAASVVVMTASQLLSPGLGIYVIANPQSGRGTFFHATTLHIGLGVLSLALAWLVSGPIGPYFDAPDLARYVPGFIAATFLERVAFMPERVLIRELRFPEIAKVRTACEITYTAVSLGLAVAGWGAMAIVWGNVARSVVRLAAFASLADRREWLEPCKLQLSIFVKMLRFGVVLSISGLLGVATRRWDNLIVSRLFGPAVLGSYNLAYNLADIPAVQIGEQVSDVLQPSFAKMEPERRPAALLRAVSVLTLVMAPLSVGLGLVAPTLSTAFFPAKWVGVGSMLMVLSIISLSRPITHIVAAFFIVSGRQRHPLWMEALTLGVMMGCLLTVGKLGPLWACGAVGIAFTFRLLLTAIVLRAAEGISPATFLWKIVPPTLACVPMGLAVLGARHGLVALGLKTPLVFLACEIAAGGLAFIPAALLIAREPSNEVLTLLRRRRQKAATQAEGPGEGSEG